MRNEKKLSERAGPGKFPSSDSAINSENNDRADMKKRDGKSGQEKIDFKEQNASLLKQDLRPSNREVAIRDIALKSARVGLENC